MIGHKVTGTGFRGLAKYVLGKPGVQRLPVGTLAGKTPAALSQEVAWLRAARRDLSKPVLHRTLSLAPGESLTVEQSSRVAVNYMKPKSSGGGPLKPSSAETGRRLTPKMVRMGTA